MPLLTPALVILALAAPQARPDFSGRWASEAIVAPGDTGTGWGRELTIAQTADALAIEYAFFATYDLQPPMKFTFALDGRETTNTVMMGRGFQDEKSTTAWKGQSLVITTRSTFEDPATRKPATFETKRTLSLESPDTLIIETERAGALDGPPSSTRAVYRRVPAGR